MWFALLREVSAGEGAAGIPQGQLRQRGIILQLCLSGGVWIGKLVIVCSFFIKVDVVTDDYSTVPKNDLYASPREEKMARGALRSAVERYLSPGR